MVGNFDPTILLGIISAMSNLRPDKPGLMENNEEEKLDDSFSQLVKLNVRCVNITERLAPALKYRLSDTDVSQSCDQLITWRSTQSDFEPPDAYLSEAQILWLHRLESCQTPYDCVKRTITGGRVRQRRDARYPGSGRAIRKEYRMLNEEERNKFHAALNTMKNDYIDHLSKYDIFVSLYKSKRSPGAKYGASFLPWHREFLRIFELALRQYDSELAIPYWDSRLDDPLPDPRASIMWSEEFMGNKGQRVRGSPFAFWKPVESTEQRPGLNRRNKIGGSGSLLQAADLKYLEKLKSYEELTFCVNPYLEMISDSVRAWVGGHLENLSEAANDPLFFLHHCMLDNLWEWWRVTHQQPVNRSHDYPNQHGSCSEEYLSQSLMLPFAKTNADGLSNVYTLEFYQYQPCPTCNPAHPSCHSPYVFCDTSSRRCVSKVVTGGSCRGFEKFDVCYKSKCVDGICRNYD